MERNWEQEAADLAHVDEDTNYMYPEWNRPGEPPDDDGCDFDHPERLVGEPR